MVAGAADVLMALGWATAEPVRPRGGDGEDAGEDLDCRILRFLAAERHVNDIAGSLGLPVAELLPRLLDMEFRNLLERRSGDYYKRSKSGGPTRDRA